MFFEKLIIILFLFLSNSLIAAPQPEQNYPNYNIPPHFFPKNDLNQKRNSFIVKKYNLGLKIAQKEQKTDYFFLKIRQIPNLAYLKSEDIARAERLAEKAKALELLIRETWITEGEGKKR